MLLRMIVKPGTYGAIRKLYGVHVDRIQVHSRLLEGDRREYSAHCTEHGEISNWTPNMDARTMKVLEHLKAPR